MKDKNQIGGIKLIALTAIFLVSGSIMCFSQSLGDVNNSGSIDIVDALLIAQYYVGLNPANFNTAVADVNCSGGVDIVDALRVAQYYVGLLTSLSCGTVGPTAGPTTPPQVTAVPSTPGPTTPPGTLYTGNATWFDNLGAPYGGCGIGQAYLDTQHFVALNVQNSPGDYTTFLTRPIASQYASQIGAFNNGLNCGRWVHVIIGDYCNGTNDGAQNQPFCRGSTGWVADAYNGAELDMQIADSCHDGNAWCRDDAYHVDLAHASLNQFVKNGVPVGDMEPNHFNNRHVQWQYIEAPNYTGDIRIGFVQSAQNWWPMIAITHLKNGIHGVDAFDGTSWVKCEMNKDMGQSYLIVPTVAAGSSYRIRVYDVTDQLINNGRVYVFSIPPACGSSCNGPFTETTYTVE
jgi:expansin (peptidoglycan-binding protein)